MASASAASATWNGTTDATWAGTGNWSATPVPGTGDTATFNNAGTAHTTIDLGSGVTISSLIFDTSSAAAYTIGSGAVNSQILTLNDGGGITMNSTVTNAETINATVDLSTDTTAATFTLTNNSASSLTLAGSILNPTASPGLKTILVNGTGNTTLGGQIGTSTALGDIALIKDGSGTLTVSGNNKMTGAISIKDGTLLMNTSSSFFNGTTATTPLTIGDGTGAAASAVLKMNKGNGGIGANSAVINISSDGQMDLNGQTIGTLANNLPTLNINFTNGGGGSVVGNGASSTGGGTWLMGTAASAAGAFTLNGLGSWKSAGGLFHILVNDGGAGNEVSTVNVNGGASFLSQGGNILVSSGSSSTDTTTIGAVLVSSSGTGTIDTSAGTGTGTGYLIFGWGDTTTIGGTATMTLRNSGAGTFTIAGNVALGEVALTGAPALTTQEITNQSNRTLQVTPTNAAAIINVSAVISDSNSTGAGTPSNNGIAIGGVAGGKTIFSGANTYTGGTSVVNSTFLVNNTTGSGTGTGFVTMTSGVLGGSGIIAPTGTNKVTASGGTVTPGSGTDTGHLTISALGTSLVSGTAMVQLAGAGLSFNLSSSNTSSYLSLASSYAGEVSGLSGNTISLTDLTSGHLSVGEYTLILSDSTANPFQGLSLGVLSGFTLTGLTGYTEQLELNQLSGSNDYAIQLDILSAPVPEPKTWALLIGGLLLMVACQRRRQLGLN